MVRIEAGTFEMGMEDTILDPTVRVYDHCATGDYDEHPCHTVTISTPFLVGACQITNKQYEDFDPDHRYLRSKMGFSFEDDEAAIFISRYDAEAFCRWMSEKEGAVYRLPTEAEWEYTCRAGTTTPFSFGVALPDNYQKGEDLSWYPDPNRTKSRKPVDLTVGNTPANVWGLFDMHGNVEEWCADWWAPYPSGPCVDPVGPKTGIFAVTRGGSHSTHPYYLRSSNRSATLPESRSWIVGFRVVKELEEVALSPNKVSSTTTASGPARLEVLKMGPRLVLTTTGNTQGGTPDKTPVDDPPFFAEPIKFVRIPAGSFGPLFSEHNHEPALIECANGDLFAIWFSTFTEPGREMSIVQSRLKRGTLEWEPAMVFLDAPDRNMTGLSLWRREDGVLYQFGGISAAATWGNLATYMRTSADNGYTWTNPRLIHSEYTTGHMPIDGVFRAQDGAIVIHCDAATGGNGGTFLYISYDEGKTWKNPGGRIAGIHAAVIQLEDGRLLAFGRGDSVNGRMPKSVSHDMGKNWQVTESPFDPVGGVQRPTVQRVSDNALMLVSYTPGALFKDAAGVEFEGLGMFAAVSFDEGETWPIRKLISDNGPERTFHKGERREFTMSKYLVEHKGYLSSCVGMDGSIHLISSFTHYQFNRSWLFGNRN
jgi:formylglycine-generating enzyme